MTQLSLPRADPGSADFITLGEELHGITREASAKKVISLAIGFGQMLRRSDCEIGQIYTDVDTSPKVVGKTHGKTSALANGSPARSFGESTGSLFKGQAISTAGSFQMRQRSFAGS
jgi:hypothetical protein